LLTSEFYRGVPKSFDTTSLSGHFHKFIVIRCFDNIEIKNNLEKAGMKTFDSFLALQFTRGKLVDGEQNIDNFVNTVLKIKK
jgi:hypothetical protein